MSQQRIREFRRQANEVAKAHVSEIAPRVDAALENERLTRDRVGVLEDKVKMRLEPSQELVKARIEALDRRITVLAADHDLWVAREHERDRGLWSRLRWLFKGSK